MDPAPRLSTLRCLHLYLLLLAVALGGLWSMDRLTDPGDRADRVPAAPAPAGAKYHAGPRRMFVFIIDSLRFQTATDPTRMPSLVALQQKSVHARMRTTRDAVTVPALRAAFTGRERVSVFGFVRNLWHGVEGFESVFSQLAGEGQLRSLVYSDGSFKQFGDDLDDRRPNEVGEGDQVTKQNRALEEGLAAYLGGEYDLVIVHINYSDAVAHAVGIHGEEYQRQYAVIDDLIRHLDEAVPPDESLMIMGDHGHDEVGRHLMGLDVPTFALYRGAGYRPGVDLGTIPIADTRYLVGWGLKLPLPEDYRSGRHPRALVPEGTLPPAYATSFDALAEASADGRGVPPGRRGEFFLTVVSIGLLISLWGQMVRGPRPLWYPVGVWSAVALLAFPDLVPAGAGLGLLISLAVLASGALFARSEGAGAARTEVTVTVLLAIGALAFAQWGSLLSLIRAWVHWPSYETLVLGWATAYLVGLAVTIRWGAMKAAWGLFAVSQLLFYPSVYRYGAAAAMAPVWVACLLFLLAQEIVSARVRRSTWKPDRAYLLLVPIGLLLLPFGLVYADNFKFTAWFGPVAWAWWGGPGTEKLLTSGLVLALAAKLIVFVRWKSGPGAKLAALSVVALLQVVQMNWVGFNPAAPVRWAYVAGILGFLVAALALSRFAARRPDGRHLARIAWLGLLFLVFYYTIRSPGRAPGEGYLWADCLLAAVVLTARVFELAARREDRRLAYPLMLLIGVLITGWVTLAWTLHRLEWGFLYDWFEPRFVEVNVDWFVLPIVLRYCIPLIMVRILLHESLGRAGPYPQQLVLLLAGLRTFAVLMVALGMGFHDAASDVYLEAVQETAIWCALIVALPFVRPSART